MTSAYAQNYIYNNLGPYYGAVALGDTVGIPSPFEEISRGYFLYGEGASGLVDPHTGLPEKQRDEKEEDFTAIPDPTSSSSSKLNKTSLFGKLLDYVEDRITGYMAFPKAVSPLTGTVRATGLSPMMGSMLPSFFGPLMEVGGKLNTENLYRIAKESYVNPEYSMGMMGNQLVGVEPTRDTFAGKILGAIGIDLPGYTLSGNIGGFTNVDQTEYEEALTTSLLANRPTIYGPGRSVAMGLKPGDLGYMDATFSTQNITRDVVTQLGIDPFGPDFAGSSTFQSFTVGGGGKPDPTRTGSIVGSYDPHGNWQPVTNPYSTYAFSNMPSGTTASKLADAGITFHTSPYGTFEMHDSKGSGWGKGGGKGSPHDNTAQSQANQGGGREGFGGQSGPSGQDSFGGGQAARGVAKGGRIGYAMGTPKVTQGFINKDPDSVTDEQSIADNRYTKVELATMVMNQPSNDKYEKHLDKLIAEAKRNVKLSDKKYKMVDVALSDGERTIHPEYVAYIEKKMGKGYLEKLNDEGKPEVSRRQAKYGSKIQGAQYGGIQTDRGFVQQFIRPDDPTLTSPTPTQQGFINQPPVSIDDDMYFGRRFGDIKSAIQTVEIKGFEDNPFIFTGIKRKGAASSAFGPMQITASTLKDIKDRSKLYDLLGAEEKQYMDLLIQQGDDKVNIEKYRSMYRDGKKVNTPKDIKKLYGRFGKGQISQDLHKKYYDTIANITLMQKLQDHKTLEDALASYGEGKTYSQKVLKNLK